MATDGYFIFVNPDFTSTLDDKELQFCIAHEMLHCLLGHFDRRGDRTHSIWNEATDYATNLMLSDFGLKMPTKGLISREYRGMTAEKIYDALITKSSSQEHDGKPSGGQESTGVPQRGAGGFDVHLQSDDPRVASVTGDKDAPSPEERRRIRGMLTRDFASHVHGTAAGAWQEEVQLAGKGIIPWDVLLSRFFSGLRSDDYRLLPPNKKHLWRGMYLPSVGVPGPSHIAVAIDTSYSLQPEDLSSFLTEIDSLRSATQCKLTVIQCDADIQEISAYEAHESASFDNFVAIGRGGTAFEPVLDWANQAPDRGEPPLDALIYMTDGFGHFPEDPPDYPLLWVTPKNANPNIPYGEVIVLSNQKNQAAYQESQT